VTFVVRLLLFIVAIFIILVGIVAMVSPIPFGILLITLGLALLAIALPAIFKPLRKRWRWLDTLLDAITERIPGWLARRVKDSDPDDDETSEKTTSSDLRFDANNHDERAKSARRILMD